MVLCNALKVLIVIGIIDSCMIHGILEEELWSVENLIRSGVFDAMSS